MLGVLALLGLVLVSPSAVQAGAITGLSVTVSDTSVQGTADWTIALTPEQSVPAKSNGGRIHMCVYGPGSMSFRDGSVALDSSASTSGLSIYERLGNCITLQSNSEIAGGTVITAKLTGVRNPDKAGRYVGHIYSSTYGTARDGTSRWGGLYNSSFTIGDLTKNTISGTVTDANGAPVRFASVSVWGSGGGAWGYSYTDQNGQYAIGSLTTGSYNFSVYGPYNEDGIFYFAPDVSSISISDTSATTKNASFLATPKTLQIKVEDGSGTAITDAYVSIWSRNGNGWAQTKNNTNGVYKINVPKNRTFGFSVYPQNWPSTWQSCGSYNEEVTTANTDTAETVSKTFKVSSLNATVKGKIERSDDSTPKRWSVSVSFQSSGGCWASADFPDDTGNFSAKVVSGETITATGWVSSDLNESFPTVSNFSVQANQEHNLGVIKLKKRDKKLAVTVVDKNGDPVNKANVYAWKTGGSYEYANGTTGSDGNAELFLSPGSWNVSAGPEYRWNGSNNEYDYVSNWKSQLISFSESDTTKTIKFIFQKVTSTINVTVTDEAGSVLNLSGSLSANDGSQEWSNIWSQLNSGKGKLRVPRGTWSVNASIWDETYSSPNPVDITIGDNETKEIKPKALINDSTISGKIYTEDEDGNRTLLKNTWLSIYANKKNSYSSWRSASVNQEEGTYSIKVSSGDWRLGYWFYNNNYMSGYGNEVDVSVKSGETKTQDIILRKANYTISVKALDPDGKALMGAWITADTRNPKERTEAGTWYSTGTSTNNQGEGTIQVSANTYWISGSMWSGYISPERQEVKVNKDNPTASVTLQFGRSDATISGTVKLDDKGTKSFVNAVSEKGRYAETNSSNEGHYILNVSKDDTWVVKAVKKDGATLYRSDKNRVDLTGKTTGIVNLDLVKETIKLPEGTTSTFNASQSTTVKIKNGNVDEVIITVPTGTLSSDNEQITVTADVTEEVTDTSTSEPVFDYGYDINANGSQSGTISQLKDNVTVTVNYSANEQAIQDEGTEEDLVVARFNNEKGEWEQLQGCATNKDDNTITCQNNHFTKFAVVASTDITPPSAPGSQKAIASNAKISLSWSKPSQADFAGVNIYRSTESGKLGDKIYGKNTSTSHDDTVLINDTVYYYTLKSVDKAGNESTASDQLKAKPSATSPESSDGSTTATLSILPKTGQPASPLNWLLAILTVISLAGVRASRIVRIK